MPRGSERSRLQRLDELTALLKSGDHVTVGGLAAALRVSQRTLTRDIELLRERGLPIEAAVGRGGGVRLHRHWSVGRATLSYGEAIDLLLSLALAEKLGSPFFLRQIRALRNKLSLTFSAPDRERIRLLRQRILVGERASAAVVAGFRPTHQSGAAAVHEAFFAMRRLEIAYTDEHGIRTARLVEPHFLLLSWPVWYLLAWDHLRRDVRSFRIDRIRAATLMRETFRLRDARVFRKAIEGIGEPI
jgi:predicted DNA-binding transcriptional regulator YafY